MLNHVILFFDKYLRVIFIRPILYNILQSMLKNRKTPYLQSLTMDLNLKIQ